MKLILMNLILATVCLTVGGPWAMGQTPTYQVVGQYTDRENEVSVDLYIETLEKFLSLAAIDPLSATDPERIVADSLDVLADPEDRTFLMVEGINLPRCEGPPPCFFQSLIDPLPLVQQGVLIFDVPYIVLAVYTDNVERAEGGSSDLEIRYYGTHSPGVFVFDSADFVQQQKTGFLVEAFVDPFTERPIGEAPGTTEERVDIGWLARNVPTGATATLFYDRDNIFQIRDDQGTLLATLVGGASVTFNENEFFSNNGVAGIDYGVIDLTSDARFPPPPPTGSIDTDTYDNTLDEGDPFNWDFSAVPQGRYYVYALLRSEGKEIILDYSTYALQIGTSGGEEIPRWPFLIGDAVDDRFVQGVAINDVVSSATNLDVVAVAQSGLFRVLDHLGRSWPPYEIDLDVTIDTAPCVTDIDGDDVLEILLGTNLLSSDSNPLFEAQNAILSIDPVFRPAYEQALAAVRAGTHTLQEALVQFGLLNDIYFIPTGHRVFSTPFVQDSGNEGAHEVVYVSRPVDTGGDSLIEAVIFSDDENTPPQAVASIVPTGVGVLGTPAVGNVDADPAPEIVVGSESGKVYVFELTSGVIGAPIFALDDAALQSESFLRTPALADIDGDGEMEIFIAVSERDRDLPGRTQLHLMHGDGASAVPGSPDDTLLYEPIQEYSSLSTPVVARLGTANDSPLAVLFATEGAFVGIDVGQPTGTEILFEEGFAGGNRSFASSSPIVGETHPGNGSYEIVLGGGRGTKGNLFGVRYNSATGNLDTLSGFSTHPEPVLPGRAAPASILGSPEMADIDGNQKTDVIYTNEEGYIDRFEAPDSFVEPLVPANFPWPFFKHDHNRSGALGESPIPIAPFKPGDINRDGVVDENDLFEMAKRWSRARSFPSTDDTGGGKVADDGRKMPQEMLLKVLFNLRVEQE